MVIGAVRIELFMPEAQSLKDKRAVIRRFKDRLRGEFNVAVAEVDPSEKWQRAAVGLTTVGADRRIVEAVVRDIIEWIRAARWVEVLRIEEEYLHHVDAH